MKNFKKSMSIALFALIAAGTTNVLAMQPQPSNDDNKQEDGQSSENRCIDSTAQPQLLIADCSDTTILVASFLEQKDALLRFALVSRRHYIAARDGLSNINFINNMSDDRIKAIFFIADSITNNITAHFPGLISICAKFTQITDQTAKDIVTVYKRLQKLYLTNCSSLTNPNISSDSLLELDLSSCDNLTNPNISSDNLLKLNLMLCPNLTDTAIQTITQNCPNLLELTLSQCHNLTNPNISSNSLQKLNLSHCPSLMNPNIFSNSLLKLDLRRCPNLTTTAVQTIAQNCPNLQQLYLSFCPTLM